MENPKNGKSGNLFRWLTLLLTAVTAVMLYLQLEQLQSQSSAIHERLVLDKKPYGWARCIWPADSASLPHYLFAPTEIFPSADGEGFFTIWLNHLFSNQGKEKLVLLGSIGYRTGSSVRLLHSLRSGSINFGDINLQENNSFTHRTVLLPSDARLEKRRYYKLPFQERYFFNTVYFYEDLSGGLYAQEHVDIFDMGRDTTTGSSFIYIAKIDYRDEFHDLSPTDRQDLIQGLAQSSNANEATRSFAELLKRRD